MKFLKPLTVGKKIKPAQTISPRSFEEKRAQQMNQSLNRSLSQRKELLKKEYVSPEPLQTAYRKKGQILDARIRKLTDQK